MSSISIEQRYVGREIFNWNSGKPGPNSLVFDDVDNVVYRNGVPANRNTR